mgnify:CR=1 FL=1
MANIKSQKKRVLTNEKAHKRNVAVKSSLKTAFAPPAKPSPLAIRPPPKPPTRSQPRSSTSAGAGVIHKNQAANRKSGLAVAINAL